ncbi:MAG: LolA family protein [Phycisphaeraceae bacterium]
MRIIAYNPFVLLAVCVALLSACTAVAEYKAAESEGAGQAPAESGETLKSPPEDDAEPDAETLALLRRIEAASADLETFKTRVRYTRIQTLTGDEQRRFGDFYYAAGKAETPTRFAVMFDRLVVDERARPMQTWYVFDGNWLLERDHDRKTAVRRELVPAGAERSDTLDMGQGQMPIPLKIKAEELLENYRVQRLPNTPFGDRTLHHLRLTPRQHSPERGDEPVPMDLWFDSETLRLHKVVTTEDADEIEMLFPTPELNPEIADEVFKTEPPDEADGWQVQEVPLDD